MPGLSGLTDKRPIGALAAAPDAAKPLQMEIRMSEIVNSTRTFAAIRARRTMVAKLLDRTVNDVARAGLFGPCLVAGSPMSYWQGVHEKNPTRYSETGGSRAVVTGAIVTKA